MRTKVQPSSDTQQDDMSVFVDAKCEAVFFTGDKDSPETCERHVSATLAFGEYFPNDEGRITIKLHTTWAAGDVKEFQTALTLDDARGLVRCLELVLAKVPVAERYVDEASNRKVPAARLRSA